MERYDVAVIGAGVVGSAVARELSRYAVRIGVFEKEPDVACGNSGRNTGMLHAGFTYKPGSLKAACTVEGNQEFDLVDFVSMEAESLADSASRYLTEGSLPECPLRVVTDGNVTHTIPAEMIQLPVRAEKLSRDGDLEVSVLW